MTDLTHEQIDEMEASREMDYKVAKEIFDLDCLKDPPYGILLPTEVQVRNYSSNIKAAWEVDKEGWKWDFTELDLYLYITLYPADPFPVHVSILWKDYKTKAQAYAVGRCRAALKAVIGIDK